MLSVSLVRCNENIVVVRHSSADKSPAANSDVISLSVELLCWYKLQRDDQIYVHDDDDDDEMYCNK